MAEGRPTTEAPALPILSIQQRLEQIEAAISEANSICSRVMSFDEQAEKDPVPEGALDAADRCINRLQLLNERLVTIADRVGHL